MLPSKVTLSFTSALTMFLREHKGGNPLVYATYLVVGTSVPTLSKVIKKLEEGPSLGSHQEEWIPVNRILLVKEDALQCKPCCINLLRRG